MELKKALKEVSLTEPAADAFLRLYARYRQGTHKITEWQSIRSPDPEKLITYESLPVPGESAIKKAISRLVVCKLNGGLGTSMGCREPKSFITVRQGKSFLDLIFEQLTWINNKYQAEIPLILMNSFYTDEQTRNVIKNIRGTVKIRTFQQNKFPRLYEKSFLPLSEKEFGLEAWYPPGHGDLYSCFYDTGLLDRLLGEGREILFISNADNLGAVVDTAILNSMLDKDIPFLMEMTEKTAADTKGGTLYQDNGKLKLLEIARVPDAHMKEFCSREKFRIFNTNNIWINLPHLKKKLDRGPMDLDVIVNRKSVTGHPVIQLETAVGSALESFSGAVGLVVPRDRFLPVKKTDNLLLIQSDLFVQERGYLIKNPARKLPGLPLIRLGSEFANLEDFQSRIPVPPDVLDLESLEMRGDVRFEGKVTLKGRVRLISRQTPVVIPQGAVLDNHELEQ